MALAPVFNLAADNRTVTLATPLAAGSYTLQLVATQAGAGGSPLTVNIPITVQAALPAAPTSLTRVSNTNTSAVISFAPSAGPLDVGRYQVQYFTGSGTYTDNGPSIPYCTPLTGSVTDSRGNVWTIAATSGGNPNAVLVNGSYSNGFNASILHVANGAVWHQNTGGSWYSFTPGGSITDGSTVAWAQQPASPLTIINVPGLTASTAYSLRVYATNTAGSGAPTAAIQFTTTATGGLAAPPQAVAAGYSTLAFFSGFDSASEVTKDKSGGTTAKWYAVPSVNYSISNSILTLRNTGPYNFNADINTVTGANATRVTRPGAIVAGDGNGLRFQYGYFEAMLKIDPNNISGTGWIAWWCHGFQHNYLNDHSKNSIEFDFFEYFQTAGGQGSSTGLWNWASSPITTFDTFASGPFGDAMFTANHSQADAAAGNFADWFIVGGLSTPTRAAVWWNTKAGRANGIADTRIIDIDTTRTYVVNSAGVRVNAVFDASRLCDWPLLLGGSSGSDYLIDYVAVWQ